MARKKKKNRSSWDDDLENRTRQSHDEKDGTFVSIFNMEALKKAKVKLWKPDPGDHVIDILPFIAGSQNNKVKKGKRDYVLDIMVHNNVGPMEGSYICLARTYGEKCPICEYRQKLRDEGADDETIKKLYPKRRVVYALYDHDKPKEGVQIWNTAHFFMEAKLQEAARSKVTGKQIVFAKPGTPKDPGHHVTFTIKSKGKHVEYTGHTLEKREEPVDEEILEAVPCLDELLTVPTYEDVHNAFFAGGGEDDEEDDLESELEDMDRKELKAFIKEEGLEVKVLKSDDEDDIREKIIAAIGEDDDEEEEREDVDWDDEKEDDSEDDLDDEDDDEEDECKYFGTKKFNKLDECEDCGDFVACKKAWLKKKKKKKK